MSTDIDEGTTNLAPDEAFAVLGNETRMEIIQTLGESDEPLSFSTLREQVGMRDSGQFSYHLDKLVGHFVKNTDKGYDLLRAGERIIEAVVSGAITETPVIEPTQIDWPCSECGAPVKISYQQEWLAITCTECPGIYSGTIAAGELPPGEQVAEGYLGGMSVPPAALKHRLPAEVHQAAKLWGSLEWLAVSSGTCPRCSAPVDVTMLVCDDHETSDGLCHECGFKDLVKQEFACPNCPYSIFGPVTPMADTEMLAFLTANGYNPVRPSAELEHEMRTSKEEEILSRDPYMARLTWTLGNEALTLTVDETLTVVEHSIRQVSDTG